MLDLSSVIGFKWDKGNETKNDDHKVSQAEAEEVFLNQPFIAQDLLHSKQEQRWHALGTTHLGRLLHVTFTLRKKNTLIRVISARPMSRKERQFYETL